MAKTPRAGLPPLPAKTHRTEGQPGVSTVSPFARLNQDCVDAIVEYAAGSMRAALALRGVSWGLCRGVSSLVRFRCHGAKRWSWEALTTVNCATISAVAKHLGQQVVTRPSRDPQPPSCLTAAALMLVALVPAPTALDLSSGSVSAAGLRRVAGAAGPQLETIDLTRVQGITDKGMAALAAGCAFGLRQIRVDFGTTDAGLVAIAKHCPSLESLSVGEGFGHVTDDGIAAIAKQCTKLRSLVVDRCEAVGDAGLEAVAARCPTLRHLSFYQSEVRATRRGLAAIAMGCPLLEKLNLSTPALSDSVVKVFAACCPKMQHISLFGDAISESALVAIPKNCPALESLDLWPSLANVTDAVLAAIAEGCPGFRILAADGGPSLTPDGIQRFVAGCPSLRILVVRDTGFPGEVILRLAKASSSSVRVFVC